MRPRIVIAAVLLCVSVVAITNYWWPWKVVRDNHSPFSIDPNANFRIELGRGSGMHGLETVRLAQNGRVELCRQRQRGVGDSSLSWEVGVIVHSSDDIAAVLQSIEKYDLMSLHRSYSARNIADGTQWVLLIQQGAHEKSVYFDNAFPEPIRMFSDDLDAILLPYISKVSWRSTSRPRHDDLWDSIRR